MKAFLAVIVIIGAVLGFLWINKEEILLFANQSAGNVTVVSEKKLAENQQRVVETEEVPFSTEEKTTSALRSGTVNIVRKGEPGEKTVVYTVTYKDGQEVERKVESESIVKKPLSEIVVRGTLVVP